MNTTIEPPPFLTVEKSPVVADHIRHPVKRIVKQFTPGGRRTRKYDGVFNVLKIAGCTVLAEHVRPKSGGFFTAEDRALLAEFGEFWAVFDVLSDTHGDLQRYHMEYRQGVLNSIARYFGQDGRRVVLAEDVGYNDQTAESVIARGGEGVCRVDWAATYADGMEVIKAAQIYVCRVTRTGATQSVGIVDAATGEDRGNVKLGGGKCDQVRAGSIIRVEGMGLTDAGKIRQPVACREWLVKF